MLFLRRKCPYCRNNVRDNAAFCDNCGRNLIENESVKYAIENKATTMKDAVPTATAEKIRQGKKQGPVGIAIDTKPRQEIYTPEEENKKNFQYLADCLFGESGDQALAYCGTPEERFFALQQLVTHALETENVEFPKKLRARVTWGCLEIYLRTVSESTHYSTCYDGGCYSDDQYTFITVEALLIIPPVLRRSAYKSEVSTQLEIGGDRKAELLRTWNEGTKFPGEYKAYLSGNWLCNTSITSCYHTI